MQSKRNNTSALKRTLQVNYQKMLYCMELLQKANNFGQSIKSVASDIQSQIKKSSVAGSTSNSYQQLNTIQHIQTFIRNGKIIQAMQMSYSQQVQNHNHIFYLRLQIITKIQNLLCLYELKQAKLKQFVQAITMFLTKQQTQKNGQSNSRQHLLKNMKDFPQKCLINLLHKRLEILQEGQDKNKLGNLIMQSIFEFKLLNLNSRIRTDYTNKYFHNYFKQLYLIIHEYKQYRHHEFQGSQTTLSTIFTQCSYKIKNQLADIFIRKLPNGQIDFKIQLYEQLTQSNQFQKIINQFYDAINQQHKQEIAHPLCFIKDLWHNYFINLVQISICEASPAQRIPALRQNSNINQNIPQQLHIFVHDYSLEQSISIIKQYRKKNLQFFARNLNSIMTKCSPTQLKMLQTQLNQKMDKNVTEIIQFQSNLQIQKQSSSRIKLRKILLLNILANIFNQHISILNSLYQLKLDDKKVGSSVKIQNSSQYWKAFQYQNGQKTINQCLFQFDYFFVGYMQQFNEESIQNAIKNAISNVSLPILRYVQSQNKKQMQNLDHTLKSLEQRKERPTIFQKIVVPYIAKNIFMVQSRQASMQNSFYSKYLVKGQDHKTPAHLTQPFAQEQFQIGEKQQQQEYVKPKIGKSIKSVGNQSIANFKKKPI